VRWAASEEIEGFDLSPRDADAALATLELRSPTAPEASGRQRADSLRPYSNNRSKDASSFWRTEGSLDGILASGLVNLILKPRQTFSKRSLRYPTFSAVPPRAALRIWSDVCP